MIFVFHGDNQTKLREELRRFRQSYGEATFWEKELSGLPAYLSAPQLFGKKELVIVEDPPLEQIPSSKFQVPSSKDIAFIFSRKLTKKEEEGFKGAKISIFWEEVPKSVFGFLDALLAREKRRAFVESHRLLREGSDPDYLLKMIAWQFRNLAKVQGGATAGLNPFVVKKLQRFARSWDPARIRQALSLTLHADLSQKKGRKTPLDFLIDRLTS